ncbi:polymer-forming cytoskeletal protein [Deinococcus radiophilus]|uniref:Polymer-forming cytoskeletal protein n=1 Tax=Deinococcus radiophilus TaxID=32062 RepID=A0A3S0I5N0_9DEIO|nr:polymer-forming cytoskeletal protein [Deinococcus radiophilus]RTR25395.1 polymer-forming cytoskeletal protein [Deinococcus radiophilus]UFA50033.1 polymer-forming cytoskeletal protein [Deinococcus radiophilus]
MRNQTVMGKLSLQPSDLELLHRAAELQAGLRGTPLTADELARLATFPTELRAEVDRWAALPQLLNRPAWPAAQSSLAARTAAEIALGHKLRTAPAPDLPRSQARELSATLHLAAQLSNSPHPPLPHSVARDMARQISLAEQLIRPSTPLPRSVAGHVAQRIAQATRAAADPANAPLYSPHPDVRRQPRAAPLALVGSLIAGLLLLGVSSTWAGLSAGAVALRSLLSGLPATFMLGTALLLLTSAWIAAQPHRHLAPAGWPRQAVRIAGSGAFALAALLTFPTLYGALHGGGVTLGQDQVVQGLHQGNLIVLGADVYLQSGSQVTGQVLTLLGDIHREADVQVSGPVTALLGHDTATNQPQDPLTAWQLASASAFRPLLGWLGSTGWTGLFWILTSALTLLLFVSGAAGRLAGRQQHAPLRTLALGVLAMAALLLPAALMTFAGWVIPALGLVMLLVLLVALGLGVSAFDLGRQLACRLHVRLPDTVGVVIALLLLAATVAWPSLTLAVILIGGAWGSGALLLAGRQQPQCSS